MNESRTFFLLWSTVLPLKSSQLSIHIIFCAMVSLVLDIVPGEGAEPAQQSSRFSHMPHLNHREDTPPTRTPSIYVLHPHPLEHKSFNHLNIWAYSAVAFILLAVTTVFAYLLYTCYHSGKSKQRGNGATWTRVPGLGGNKNISMPSAKVGDVGEKAKPGNTRVGSTFLELRTFGFGHNGKQSESHSEVNSDSVVQETADSFLLLRPKWFDYPAHPRPSARSRISTELSLISSTIIPALPH
jgi:hypothetical protein